MSINPLPPADFGENFPDASYTPSQVGYTGQGAFRFWCQTVLPLVYDDSLSYYELLNKVVHYLNNVISDVSNVEYNVTGLFTSYTELQDYVNNNFDEISRIYNELEGYVNEYFSSLDVQEEINIKLDNLVQNGTLTSLITPLIMPLVPELITNWLNEHITPTSPIVDSSLSISGAAADSKTTGDEINDLKSASEETKEILDDITDKKDVFLDNDSFEKINGLITDGITHFIDINSGMRTLYFECLPNTRYTISKILSSRFAVGYTTEIPVRNTIVYGYESENEETEIVINTGDDAEYIVVYYYRSASDAENEDVIYNSIRVSYESIEPVKDYELWNNVTKHTFTLYGRDAVSNDRTSIYTALLKPGCSYAVILGKTDWKTPQSIPSTSTRGMFWIESCVPGSDINNIYYLPHLVVHRFNQGIPPKRMQITIPMNTLFVSISAIMTEDENLEIQFVEIENNSWVGNTILGSVQINEDLRATLHSYIWGEGIKGSKYTPFIDCKAIYNGSTAQSDYRIITYEDGSPIIEKNKVYISMSSTRSLASPGLLICELDLTTCQMRMTGCILAYCNNEPFSASGNEIMLNRNTGKWLLLTHGTISSANIDHKLLVSESISDPRFGIGVYDYELMGYDNQTTGDEDQFVFWDSDLNKWVMVCASATNDYLLKLYYSDNYKTGYTLQTQIMESISGVRATGVTCVKIGGTRYVLAGSSHTGVNKFLVLSYPQLNVIGELNLDYPTGARLGVWPNLFPVVEGNKTRYWIVTFDRSITNNINNYSYGAIYVYKSEECNDGMEFPISVNGTNVYEPITNTYGPTQLHFRRQWAKRNAMNFEIKLSEISIHEDVLLDQSNVYPTIGGSTLQIRGKSLFLENDGEDAIICGEHIPYSAYVLNPQNINNGDKRYIAIADTNGTIKVKIMIDHRRRVYVYNGTEEVEIATMTSDRKNLIVCTSGTMIYLYEK